MAERRRRFFAASGILAISLLLVLGVWFVLPGQYTPAVSVIFVTADPAGACQVNVPMQYNTSNGKFWGCTGSVWTLITAGSGSPTGAAGGDLSGSYPNPNVASIGGKTVTLSGNLTTTGAFSPTLAFAAGNTYTFPTASTTLATLDANTFTANQTLPAAGRLVYTNRAYLNSISTGALGINNSAGSHTVSINSESATLSSGFGTSPAVTGTTYAGSVNVGTGGTATSGVITINNDGTSTHFCIVWDETTPTKTASTSCTATSTAITISTTSAWNASDVLHWIQVGVS